MAKAQVPPITPVPEQRPPPTPQASCEHGATPQAGADRATAQAGAAIALDRVWVYRGNRLVLDEVSAVMPPGSFTGLVGLNGCGKTTLLQVILGLVRPETGTVRVFGLDPARSPAVRRNIGYLAQNPRHDPLFPVSAADVVEMGAIARAGVGLPRNAALRALGLIGLGHLAAVPFGRLSGGQRQLVLLARAIAGGPRLLLLDEPLTGLDQRHRAGFYPLVNELRRGTGLTVVAVCHDFRALLPHVDRLLCLDGSLHVHSDGGGAPKEWENLAGQDQCLFEAVTHSGGRSPAG